jgi:hypothetical protein
MQRRKIIGAAVFSAAIAAGGFAGVVLGSPAASSAATGSGSSTTTTPGHWFGRGMGRQTPELDAAAKANFDSNVTQRITDEVNGTFQRPDGPVGPGGPARGFGFRGGFGLDAAAKAIGVSTDTLLTDLKGGKTIAQVAASKGVAVKTVVDAMVAAAKTEFDSQVKAGRLPAAMAARIEANLQQIITDQVNGPFLHPPFPGGRGGPGAGGFGFHGFGGLGSFGGPMGHGPGATSGGTTAAPTA